MNILKTFRDRLKNVPILVKVYQRLIGYTPHNKHWCRVVMDIETEKIIRNLEYANFNTLEISGTKWSAFGFKDYKFANYPEFDICKDKFETVFDMIIAEQVFEHLLLPYRAGKNVYDMLKKGGYFLITTPFLIRIHEYPVDCTRWTSDGLKYFLSECGFNIEDIKVWSWGNRDCVVANLNEWMPYTPKKHSLENERDYPLVIWALARK